MANSRKAIVIGASSGIGAALAKELAGNGYEVGLVARRVELLDQLQKEIPAKTYIKRIDISRHQEAISLLQQLIAQMGGIDLIVLNSAVYMRNADLDWKMEIDTLDVNISGFVACASVAVKHFLAKNSGHLVGISSIAALRGSANSASYNASKAFVSNYLEGIRHRLAGNNIYVSDIRPGLVDTDLNRMSSRLFWVSSPEKAAKQICTAIKRKKKVAYITRRWALIAWLAKLLPDWVYRLRYRYE
jgi:short-subunit dehydrogenase